MGKSHINMTKPKGFSYDETDETERLFLLTNHPQCAILSAKKLWSSVIFTPTRSPGVVTPGFSFGLVAG